MKNAQRILKQTVIAILIALFAATPMVEARGYENFSADQLEKMGIYFTKGDYTCGASSITATSGANTGAGNGTLDLSAVQVANAKIVIGIAKTYNLGQKGALIGLMTAITESHLHTHANKYVPISKENPAWTSLPAGDRLVGQDHDSLGMFQQRVSTGWSTYGNLVTTDEKESMGTKAKNIAWQLMDPAYGAQAFFGTPPGSKLPSNLAQPTALRKGLQNIKDWEGRDPWIDSQEVQVSFDPTGSNYKKSMPDAEKILKQYWDSAQPVPLPIPIDGSAPSTPATNNNCPDATAVNGTAVEKIKATIAKYAWADYRKGSQTMKPAYISATQAAKKRGEYIGDCSGVDCGGFVTRVMRDSGADKDYNKYEGNTLAQLQYLRDHSDDQHLGDKPVKYHHVKDSEKLQPGDIAVQNNGSTHHTYFYVGKMQGLDANNKNPVPFEGNAASASQCDRAPMASNLYDREVFEWYRIIQH